VIDPKILNLFNDLDTDKNGSISLEEFAKGLKRIGISP